MHMSQLCPHVLHYLGNTLTSPLTLTVVGCIKVGEREKEREEGIPIVSGGYTLNVVENESSEAYLP